MASSTSIVQGTNSKPVSSHALVNFFSTFNDGDGELFIGYPIIASPEGSFPVDAVWVSPSKGIVIFDLIEGPNTSGFEERQDDLANKLESRLKNYKELMSRRDLVVEIHTISFAPGLGSTDYSAESEYVLVNSDSLSTALEEFSWDSASLTYYRSTLSALQNISTIRRSKVRRSITKPDSRGARLKNLEDSISTLDNLQNKAVIETVEGVQRIRGLAGSGKTIVLALKAAYLHSQHPEWQIAVTFNTRALKGQLKRLIDTFLIQTGNGSDWEQQIKILNAWGAPGGGERDGIYHQFCRSVDSAYFDFPSAKRNFKSENIFDAVCKNALTHSHKAKKLYDVILVDEAQDFPPSFLRLCYEILDDPKRLVYAYDELQNLSGTSVATPEEIFGTNPDGTPRVTFPAPTPDKPRSDIILDICYRNSRPVLVTAHALGFGIYRQPPTNRETGVVQMFGESELWREIGYEVKEGDLQDGANVVLQRTPAASPSFLEKDFQINDLIQFILFKNEEEQSNWVVNEIKKNLQQEELSYDDIVVINPDPLTTREKVGLIRKKLLESEINSHLAGVDTDPDIFFKSDTSSITFTGIYRAKGNEAGMVYIINAQDCHSTSANLATLRNRLFTAITRSKAWVRVLGIGENMQSLINEYNILHSKHYELHFRYPTQAEREQMSIVHRDISPAERSQRNSKGKKVAEVIEAIKSGELDKENIAAIEAALRESSGIAINA
jgi:superfamily I DNA and RNA helicase